MGREQRDIVVAMIGLGNVGQGVAEYFQTGRGKHFNIRLKQVAVANQSKKRNLGFESPPLTGNAQDLINDPEVDILVELMGKPELATAHIKAAMNSGKSVVTANKAALASNMDELFMAARTRNVNLAFEAAVGGGIPIIRTINDYRGEKITRVQAVVNGTTNYILTQMEGGMDFDSAVKEAQEKGFAERDHTLDTGGFDSRDKLAIISSLILNAKIDPAKISCEGILGITPIDIDFAAKYGTDEGSRGYVVKLLATLDRTKSGVLLDVSPALVSKDHPLASVRNEVNAVSLEGELSGPQTFIGKGAGTNPTTSSVIRDVIRVAENIRNGTTDELPVLDQEVTYANPATVKQRGYLRVNLAHTPGSFAAVANILSRHGLNIEDSLQRRRYGFEVKGQIYIPDITTFEAAPVSVINAAVKEIEESKSTQGKPFYLRFID